MNELLYSFWREILGTLSLEGSLWNFGKRKFEIGFIRKEEEEILKENIKECIAVNFPIPRKNLQRRKKKQLR